MFRKGRGFRERFGWGSRRRGQRSGGGRGIIRRRDPDCPYWKEVERRERVEK